MELNYIDVLIALLLALFVLGNVRRGVFLIASDLVTLVLSVVIAFRFYPSAAGLLERWFAIPDSYASALGFLVVLLVAQIVLGIVARRLIRAVPPAWHQASASQALSVVPALGHGLLLLGALLLLLMALPTNPELKRDIEQARVGSAILDRAVVAERAFADVFGAAINDTLSMLTVPLGGAESIPITARPASLRVDEVAEAELLALVNQEREARGLAPLEADATLVPVARAHSQDMWERGYFSHVNPDGADPFDRMRAGGVSFRTAAENLALAPTTSIAHRGLMDSPGHRRNILDPTFTRIGIGVIDGGVHGKMYTQLFAD